VLAVYWTWLACGYHLAFFQIIDPVALVFAAISLLASVLFLWLGVWRSALSFGLGFNGRRLAVGAVCACTVSAHQLVFGQRLPAVPTFGLPCPATIFTFEILCVAEKPLPRSVLLAPALWAAGGNLLMCIQQSGY